MNAYLILQSNFCYTVQCLFTNLHYLQRCSMDDDFSQSLTPPVSPYAADGLCDLIAPRPLCFSCAETKDDPTGALSTEGYIARGSLKRYSHYSAPWSHCFSLSILSCEQTLPIFLPCFQRPNKSKKNWKICSP